MTRALTTEEKLAKLTKRVEALEALLPDVAEELGYITQRLKSQPEVAIASKGGREKEQTP